VNRVRYIWVAIAVVAALSIAALVVAIDAGINDNEGEQGQATPASNQVTVKVHDT
jgi:flagellar basal body-associated protein FliL